MNYFKTFIYNKYTFKKKKQIKNKHLKQKTKINKDIGKIYYNIETNEEEINKINKENKTIKRAIRNRKKKNKNYDDLSLRISELKNSIYHYENDIIELKNRILEFQGLRNNKNLKITRIKQNNKLLKYNRVRCDNCKIDFHRASYTRHLKSKKHLENMTQNKVIIPRKQVVKKVDIDKNIENRYYFTDKVLKAAYNITVENHHDKNVNSKMTNTPNYGIIGIAEYHIDKIVIEMNNIYATVVNQYKFKYQLSFLVLFNKYGEEGQITSQIELPVILTFTENLTQSDLNNIDIQWTLENRIQNIEMKASCWNSQKIISMSIKFFETGILNGSSYVKTPLRSSALVNFKNDDKHCFVRSILTSLHPCNINPNTVSNYRQYFDEINIKGFDFTNGFKCSDMH